MMFLRTMPGRTLIGALLLGAMVGCARPEPAYRTQPPDPEWLHEAVKQVTDVMVHDIFSPPQASRVYAYASIAAYEALRPAYPGYRSLAGRLNELQPVPEPEPDQTYYFPLAGVQALLRVGQAMVFTEDRIAAYRDRVHARFRALGVPEPVFARSVAYGDAVAAHILAWANQDRYRETRSYPKYTVTDAPGRWRPTPPAYLDGIEPHWRELRPFVLDSAAQFAPPPPVPYDMTPGSPFYEQVREVYEVGRDLTREQASIAAFWDCNPYVMHTRGHAMFATKKITPGGHWIGITAIAARQAGADLMQAAEAYAVTSIALADAFISNWDEKYRSNLVRPETVINQHLDEAWTPLLQTPPFPEYTSGHSVISTAAALALTALFGEAVAFDDTTEVEYGLPVRSFTSFVEASQEAAISRLYGGIHYRMAVEHGVEQGRAVGRFVLDRLGMPSPALAAEQGPDATPRRTALR